MTIRSAKTPLLMLLLMLAVAPARLAFAHAFPASEQPRAGSSMSAAPSEVAITFDAPVEKLFAKIRVSNAAGEEEGAGPVALDNDRRRLSVSLKPLASGEYTVKWSVVAEDGHRTEGSFSFAVIVGGGS